MSVMTRPEFVLEVREFMRDYPELNRLNSGRETGDRLLDLCVGLAIDDWNSLPPWTGHSFTDFPSKTVLLYLTLSHVLLSASLLKQRNRLPYSDSGWSSDPEQSADVYRQQSAFLRQQALAQARALKTSINIESGWGAGRESEYGLINGWYGYLT